MATPDPTPPDRRLQTDGEAHQGGDEHHRGEEHQDVASPSDQQHPGEASPSQYTPAAPSPLSNGRSWTSKIHEFFTAKGRPALNTNGYILSITYVEMGELKLSRSRQRTLLPNIDLLATSLLACHPASVPCVLAPICNSSNHIQLKMPCDG